MERDHLLHPLFARRRTVRMDVHALRHLRIGLAGHHPSAVSKTIGLIGTVNGNFGVRSTNGWGMH